ncbi:hypothetical protein OBBRIDRAFT_802630 [Obba rivulosa]|uniref:Uncharacterized protein n=1 Tax=Obba rivulosa TaxID=1052685 RepID=A0A8E2AXH3_9APHY|nr:hypothetical protein OBBRIDRAFT_802630 [Obba rivulosa]
MDRTSGMNSGYRPEISECTLLPLALSTDEKASKSDVKGVKALKSKTDIFLMQVLEVELFFRRTSSSYTSVDSSWNCWRASGDKKESSYIIILKGGVDKPTFRLAARASNPHLRHPDCLHAHAREYGEVRAHPQLAMCRGHYMHGHYMHAVWIRVLTSTSRIRYKRSDFQ